MMTNEDKAFAFANKNADKYINDEDPLGALRDGFLCGAQWKEEQMKSPWHKVADEGFPKEAAWYLVQVSVGAKLIHEVALFDLSYGWLCRTDYGEENTVLFWMKIPELPKEEEA